MMNYFIEFKEILLIALFLFISNIILHIIVPKTIQNSERYRMFNVKHSGKLIDHKILPFILPILIVVFTMFDYLAEVNTHPLVIIVWLVLILLNNIIGIVLKKKRKTVQGEEYSYSDTKVKKMINALLLYSIIIGIIIGIIILMLTTAMGNLLP